MEIRILKDLVARLDEPENLREFKVVAESAKGSIAHVGQALTAAGAGVIDAGHAWISEQWLRTQGGDAAWQEGLGKMIDYARSKNWVDEVGRIRAHIEWK